MRLAEVLAAAETPPWTGAFMTAALLRQTGRAEAADAMAVAAYRHVAEARFELVDEMVPPVEAAVLHEIGTRALEAAKTDAVKVSSFPSRPTAVVRNVTHQTAKRARSNNNRPS